MLYRNEQAFDHIIFDELQAQGMSEKFPLVKGLIAAESAFMETARREEPQIKDASWGLMQVLGRTAKAYGFKGEASELADPRTNVKWGVTLIKDLYKRYKDTPKVVAAYNLGQPELASKAKPRTVATFGTPKADWTFSNQPYVDKVLTHTMYYRAVVDRDAGKIKLFEEAIKKKDFAQARNFSGTIMDNPVILGEC